MSFGFGVGDFLAVIALANKIRKDFLGAPKQFQEISTEIKGLEYASRDVDVFLSEEEITESQEEELVEIQKLCENVLSDCLKLLERYSALDPPQKGVKGRAKRVWQRLASEPNDVRDLRDRVAAIVTRLGRVNDAFARHTVVKVAKELDEQAKRQVQQDHQEILDWLTPINFAAQQADFIRRREPGTGQWLLESPEYKAWRSTKIPRKGEALFCPGIPGAGKTILSSIVVHDLQEAFGGDESVCIAYLYCNFRRHDEQKFEEFIASLIRQLAQRYSSCPDCLRELFKKHKGTNSRPSATELCQTLQGVAESYPQVFLIIDALDECSASDGCRMKLITEIRKLQTNLGINVLATSRFIPEITTKFQDATQLEIRASDADVDMYLQSNISSLPGFVARDLELQAEIKTKIMDSVDGMFLLAQLHLDSLKGKRSPKAVRNALGKLKKGSDAYDTAYRDAMTRINSQILDQKKLAHDTLTWITCARRPLTTIELLHALAVEVDEPAFDPDNLPYLEDTISACCGLVTVDEESKVIRLIHYTTQEFFERTHEEWFPSSDVEMTAVCTTYLAFDAFNDGPCPDEEYVERLSAYPLYDYASHYWGAHGETVGDSQSCMRFLSRNGNVQASAQGLFKSYNDYSAWWLQSSRDITELHLSAALGSLHLVAVLLNTCDVNDTLVDGRTALLVAASEGHLQVVQLLLERGAHVDRAQRDGRTPLAQAAAAGHEEVVRLLLEHGAQINATDSEGESVLALAAFRSRRGSVKLLLECGAQVDVPNKLGQTALTNAIYAENLEITRILLEHRADVNMEESDGDTPLAVVIRPGGHDWEPDASLMTILVEHGANPNVYNHEDRSPLYYAVRQRDEDLVQLLLSKGAEVHLHDEYGRTALFRAVMTRNEVIIQLLLQHGADPDTKHRDGGYSALHVAVGTGNESVVRLLLQHNADIWIEDRCGRSPLVFAALEGQQNMLDILLQSAPEPINATDYYGTTLLSVAARFGRSQMVERILAVSGVDHTLVDRFDRSALWWAQRQGHKEVLNIFSKFADAGSPPSAARKEIVDGQTYNRHNCGKQGLFCDVCLFPDTEGYWRCKSCMEYPGLVICAECKDLGAHCLDEDHEITCFPSGAWY